MSVTDSTTTEQEQRDAAIAGLHEMADFLSDHPAVPIPQVYFSAQYNPMAVEILAAWCDGLEALDVQGAYSDTERNVARSFAGLNLSLTVKAEVLGTVTEVPSTTMELAPFTVAEIVAQGALAKATREAAEAARNAAVAEWADDDEDVA